ncbi:hypothetical protein [Curtobacterium sp. B8]|uniref:hypothetical protein n=1 Tax=Curtobacterium sp. B8 TaxID=95611 RepID=UPI0011D23525|nr:hypothetical protein [Curtobacterium sp. B8]
MDWEAASQRSFVAQLSKHAADIELVATGLEKQAEALTTYAGQLTQIKDRQTVLESRRRTAQDSVAVARFNLLSAPSVPQLMKTPDSDTAEASKKHTAATQENAQADAALRQVEVEWEQLISDRRSIDAICASALQSADALGGLAGVSAASITPINAQQLLALLGTLSGADLAILATQFPEIEAALRHVDPGTVAEWWEARKPEQQQQLIVGFPAVIGSLNGLPAQVRVVANRENAKTRIEEARRELAAIKDWGDEVSTVEQRKLLRSEIDYLSDAIADPPSVQLYLYDQKHDRIVEMIGTPGPDTKRVVTYVPGTFANMDGFYQKDTQKVSRFLVQAGAGDTVAFVYKDGSFPQGIVSEANSPAFAARTGQNLKEFQDGLAAQAELKDAEPIGIGHSWGTANVTSAEEAGAHFAKVASLSGAGMPPSWQPASGTEYRDFSYSGDLLQLVQKVPIGLVWDGKNPRSSGFEHGEYYNAPFSDGPVDRHNLVASSERGNQKVLGDLERFVRDR